MPPSHLDPCLRSYYGCIQRPPRYDAPNALFHAVSCYGGADALDKGMSAAIYAVDSGADSRRVGAIRLRNVRDGMADLPVL